MKTTNNDSTDSNGVFYDLGSEWGGRASQRDFRFKLLIRIGEFAILRKDSKHGLDGFEVVHIRKRKKDTYIQGRLIYQEGDEYLPRDEEWGSHGWTYPTLEKASEKLAEVTK